MNTTNPIIEHIGPHIHQADEHPNNPTLTIPTPNSGWEFQLSMLYKIIYFMLLCTFKAKVIICNTIEYVLETLSKAIILTPIAIHKWFNKPCIRYTKKHLKRAMVVGNFLINFAQADKLVITNGTVNQEDTVVDTRS